MDIENYLEQYGKRELLRLLTCGSVDDGKSTLIGRLLHDSQMVYDDQLDAARKASARHGTTGEEVDLALLVDGLQAEREQGITIDVAYRYFSTAKRKFIIADTPGHEQYTRNMATGASTCDLAVILIDARRGVLDQTRRHSFIASLLGIRHLVVAINKMDLVEYAQDRFEEIREEFTAFSAKLQVSDIRFIPMSALRGDNIVHRSDRMSWYEGGPLLGHLESVHIASDRNLIDLRLPIQYVLRPNLDVRAYCGTVASGALRPGDEVMILPSARRTRIRSIERFEGPVERAGAGMAVTVTLEDEVDASRGDMIVHVNNVPQLDQSLEAMVVWMNEAELRPGLQYILKQTTVQTPAAVTDLRYRMNVTTLHREPASSLGLNEIGRVRIETPRLIAFDSYAKNRSTGAFILIDRITNATVAAGMILERDTADDVTRHRRSPDAATNVRMHTSRISPEERSARLGQRPLTLWLTGLPRSGKSSVAFELERRLFGQGAFPHVIDGETLRLGISSDLGFSGRDREENVRRAAELARTLNDLGVVVIVAMVSPAARDRDLAKEIIGAERFVGIYCDAPLEVCEARDTDRLFERARSGELRNVTGVDLPYEEPVSPDLVLDTSNVDLDANVERLLDWMQKRARQDD